MIVSYGAASAVSLSSEFDGTLVSVRVSADPRVLEGLLECLSGLSFPVNPELFHGCPTAVEFPAYENKVGEIRGALRACGFGSAQVVVQKMIDRLRD